MAPIKAIEKQGIVTILGSDIKQGASLRRTLSADMSSKKWPSQNGFFSMKKIASSEGLVINSADSSSSSESEEEYDENMPGQDEIWRSIQLQKEKQNNQTAQNPSRLDSWDSILSPKNYQDSSKESPPPYVHPLVKRSASSLSQKSLEICTENLGSETGSDVFSDPGPDPPKTENYCQEKVSKSFGDINVVKYKTVSPRPLPPPISSIGGGNGNSLRMHCHRQNGRLILEAVSIPSKNCFRASRHEGRLLLTLINPPTFQAAAMAEEVASPAEVEVRSVIEQNPNPVGRNLSADKSGLMVKNFVGLRNKMNSTWSNKFNKTVKLIDVGEELPLSRPLLPPRVARLISTPPPPPPPSPAAVASFNAYEYFWRNKTSFITTPQFIPLKNNHKIAHFSGEKTYEHQDLVLISPLSRGCNEQRKSLLFWEPYCIATS